MTGELKTKFLAASFQKSYTWKKKVATPKFTTPIELLLNASKVLQNCKNKKEVIFDLFVQFAPYIGESYNFNAMIAYSILLNSRR